MRSMLRDRDEFVIAAAIIGTALGVVNLAYARDWGWIPALIVLPALGVRAAWRTMPSWLLLAWTLVPTVIAQSRDATTSDYLVVIMALVVVSAHRPSRLDQVLMGVALVSPFAIWLLGTSDWNKGIGVWLWAGGLVIGWAFGTSVGQQWELIDELERTRTRLAEVAVADERRRIARELHDLVGHNFSVVLLHLAGARMVLSSEPAAAAAALRDAEEVGRRGMDELRQALLLMRDGTEGLAPVEASDLPALVERYREAGMRVDLSVTGTGTARLGDLAEGPGIVVHDIVREALTNVAKHGLDRAATVRVAVEPDTVDVRIESLRGPGPAPDRPGLGLSGLEHRVAAVNGSFSAGPDGSDGGSWVVQARVPKHLAGTDCGALPTEEPQTEAPA